jgi:hypothetical protein
MGLVYMVRLPLIEKILALKLLQRRLVCPH